MTCFVHTEPVGPCGLDLLSLSMSSQSVVVNTTAVLSFKTTLAAHTEPVGRATCVLETLVPSLSSDTLAVPPGTQVESQLPELRIGK